MKIKNILIVLSYFTAQCYAEQEPQFTMYWNNYSLHNPAATGLFGKHFASISGRDQWVGFPGNPQIISFVYDYKLTKINSGIGINYFIDQLGFETTNKININYSYQFQLKKGRVLSTGIAVGMLQKTVDYSKFIFSSPDPLFPNNKVTDNMLNINLGAMYKTPRFIFGLSITQLNEPESQKLNFKNVKHCFLTCSYDISIGQKLDVKPGIYLKSDLAATQLDINLITRYNKKYWVGFTYRISDAIAVMAGIDIKGKYRIGYSYDYTTSAIKNHSSGSHEIVLALMFDEKQIASDNKLVE